MQVFSSFRSKPFAVFTTLVVGAVLGATLCARPARAQSLPDPPFLDVPVMDVLRRLNKDRLDVRGEQVERYTKYVSVPLTHLRFAGDIEVEYAQVLATLTQIENLLRAGSQLSYASEDAVLAFKGMLEAAPGFDPWSDGEATIRAVRRTFLRIGHIGGTYANKLEESATRIAALKQAVEGVGTEVLGFEVLPGGRVVSPTQGTRLMVQNSLAGTEAIMKLRQQAALELNSFLLQAARQMQQDVIARRALECALGYGPCPEAPTPPLTPSAL